MHTAHRIKTKKFKAEKRGGYLCLDDPPDMSAELKKKKGYTTVLLRLSHATPTRGRGSVTARNAPRVRFLAHRATPQHLKASLEALATTGSY